jgi:hypothetical protein
MRYAFASVILSALLLAGCASATFNGSRTGNDSQLVMEYTVFNTTDSQTLKLEQGDRLAVTIVDEQGTLSLSIAMEGEDPLYEDLDAQSRTFELVIPKSGNYQVTVTGEQAKGSLSVVRVEPEK